MYGAVLALCLQRSRFKLDAETALHEARGALRNFGEHAEPYAVGDCSQRTSEALLKAADELSKKLSHSRA